MSILDIKAKGLDGKYFNIEIQVNDTGAIYELEIKNLRDAEAMIYTAEQKGRQEIAKKLLAAGVEAQIIAASTGLTIDEIKRLPHPHRLRRSLSLGRPMLLKQRAAVEGRIHSLHSC